MLGLAGVRRVFIHRCSGDSGRCSCGECRIEIDTGTQRTREKRSWRKDQDS